MTKGYLDFSVVANAVDFGIPRYLLVDFVAVRDAQVDHSAWQARLVENVDQHVGAQRRELVRHQQARVSGGQSRGQLGRDGQERAVVVAGDGHHAQRHHGLEVRGLRVVQADLAGVVVEDLDEIGNVEILDFAARASAAQALAGGQDGQVLLDVASNA